VRYNEDYLSHVHQKLTKYGFAVIQKRNKSIIKKRILEKMLLKAMEIEEIICNRLDSLKIPCRNISKKVVRQVNNGSKQCNFKFREVLLAYELVKLLIHILFYYFRYLLVA